MSTTLSLSELMINLTFRYIMMEIIYANFHSFLATKRPELRFQESVLMRRTASQLCTAPSYSSI